MSEDIGEVEQDDTEKDKSVEEAFAARLKSATSKLQSRLENAEQLLEEERNARLRLEEQSKPKEKAYTRAELLDLVEEEKMTQVQADKIWEEQITKNVTTNVLGIVKNNESKKQMSKVLGEYKKLKPDIVINGTVDREKVKSEFDYLVNDLGLPNSVETELAAVRNVFGPLDKIKKKLDLETHQETGGSKPTESKNDGPIKGLSDRQKQYYSKRIEQGIYKNWKEVEAELSYKSNG